jgi:hypothetical protein
MYNEIEAPGGCRTRFVAPAKGYAFQRSGARGRGERYSLPSTLLLVVLWFDTIASQILGFWEINGVFVSGPTCGASVLFFRVPNQVPPSIYVSCGTCLAIRRYPSR